MPTPAIPRPQLKAAIQDLLVRDPNEFFSILREVRDDMEATGQLPEAPTEEDKLRAEVENDLGLLADFFRGFA